MMHSLRPRISRRRTKRSRKSPSGRPIRTWRNACEIREKFGVDPPLIPDLLALVGDAADGYPGIPGIGTKTAVQLLNRYGQIENFPSNVLGELRDLALLFKKLATLR